MADLIDKKKLLKAVLDEYAEGNFYVMHLIRDFPAEEAVVPVHCGVCRYSRITEYEAAEMSKNFRVRQIEEIKQDYQKKADRLLNDYYRDGSKTLRGYDQNMAVVEICELAIKQIKQEGHNETVRYANTEAMAKGLDKDMYTKQEVSALIMQTLLF